MLQIESDRHTDINHPLWLLIFNMKSHLHSYNHLFETDSIKT